MSVGPHHTLDDTLAALAALGPLDDRAMADTQTILDGLTKPPGSLGRLEEIAVTLAGITGQVRPSMARRAIVVAAADHGIARQGVSAYPAEVTAQMVANFVRGGAAINVLAGMVGVSVTVVDVGVAGTIPEGPAGGRPGVIGAGDRPGLQPRGGDRAGAGRLIRAPIQRGTADMTDGPAMSRADAIAGIGVGLAVVADLRANGLDIVGIGEMGIGNTSAASAITSVLTRTAPSDATGRGTGIDDEAWRRKVAAIERAITRNAPDPADPIGVLAAVGGLEIAALVGVILGAAAARVPVLLDGYITGAAALVAAGLSPGIPARLLAAHLSVEPGHAIVLERLRLRPLLLLDLRLGEGTGAALAIHLIDAAVRVRDEMATFGSAGVSGPVDVAGETGAPAVLAGRTPPP